VLKSHSYEKVIQATIIEINKVSHTHTHTYKFQVVAVCREIDYNPTLAAPLVSPGSYPT